MYRYVLVHTVPDPRGCINKLVQTHDTPSIPYQQYSIIYIKMTALNNDTMDYTGTENLLRLLKIEKSLPSDLRRKINEKATNFLEDLNEDAADFVSNKLDEEQHSEDDIRTLVQCVPGALSFQDKFGGFPIFNACLSGRCVSFVPLLAEEGMKLNVGGDGMRGGLRCEHSSGDTALVAISFNNTNRYGAESECDSRYLNVIKGLREIGLFEKEDIRKYNLLWGSCCNARCPKRFNYFADWDPSALTKQYCEKYDVLHSSLQWCGDFQLALSATLRHYPHELGQLLVKNSKGETPFQKLRKQFGRGEGWKAIKKCLDESDGSKIVLEKNSETNMYPFMLAAAGDTSELDLVYYLVRRNPLSLLSDYYGGKSTDSTDMMCSGKRKR